MFNRLKSNQSKLYSHVEFLTSISPARNCENVASLNCAAAYIAQELAECGCKMDEQAYEVDGEEYRNIIGTMGPADGPRIVVGAHYDVAGDQPGADDNASAVAGLLETARLLATRSHKLGKRIDFVAYTLEEPPHFGSDSMGSAVHAGSLKNAGVEVEFMVCYEMIGYFSDEPGSQTYPDPVMSSMYPDKGNFIVVVSNEMSANLTSVIAFYMKKNCKIQVENIALPSTYGLAGLSDQRNYWKNGYPAVMINDTSFLRNPNYHQETDTIDTLDFPRMAEVVNGAAGALLELSKPQQVAAKEGFLKKWRSG